MYTTGALIFSNDGEFINIITHPSNNISKTYHVTVEGKINNNDLNKLRNGIILDDGYKTREAEVNVLKESDKKNTTLIEITINEGKNRQVRRMFKEINLKILKLHRIKIGNINITNLKVGEYRHLILDEIEYIYSKKNKNKKYN